MYSLILAALMQPAYFTLEIDGPPDTTVKIGGVIIQPNKPYKTQDILNDLTVEVEIRYVDGEKIIIQKEIFTLVAGKHLTLLVTIKARRLVLNC